MSFSATIRHVEGVSIIDVSGQLTSFTQGALRRTVAGLLQEGRKHILLNLSGLDYLDSSGIGDLVANYLSVVKAGGEMKVVGLTPKIEEILKITQLFRVFPEFQDEPSALRSFPSDRTQGRPVPYTSTPVSKN